MEQSMRLILKPEWAELERVRHQGAEFLKSQGFSTDTVDAIVMILSELAENSIKYGDFKVPENRVVVEACIDGKRVTVEVRNPVDETAHEHLSRLDKTIQWIRGYQDSFEAYVERLKEVAKKPLSDKESGLGLVRIAYEGKAILDFYVDDNETLNVSAVANVA
jgi:hypothetical protein